MKIIFLYLYVVYEDSDNFLIGNHIDINFKIYNMIPH